MTEMNNPYANVNELQAMMEPEHIMNLTVHVEQLSQRIAELEARKMKTLRLWCILASACFVGSLLGVIAALLFR